MDKKGLGRALTLLLSIAIITLEITVFYSAYNTIFKSVTFAIQEIPEKIDNNLLLLNLLRTETGEGTIADLVIQFYLLDDPYSNLKEHITIFVEEFYGENYIWHLSIDDKKVGNYNLIQGIWKGKKKYEASTLVPLHSREAVEVELSIYRK